MNTDIKQILIITLITIKVIIILNSVRKHRITKKRANVLEIENAELKKTIAELNKKTLV
ncbi:MAG: hypothetical protein KAG96_01505 [Ichthyobacteriaceae bacterium]|nr:hypothetical protein [Ichthyobacteriaceae bacterium]